MSLKSHVSPLWVTRWNVKVERDLPQVEVRLEFHLVTIHEEITYPPLDITLCYKLGYDAQGLFTRVHALSHVIPLCMVIRWNSSRASTCGKSHSTFTLYFEVLILISLLFENDHDFFELAMQV